MVLEILSVSTQEWITGTIVPIFSIVVPVWIFLSMSHKNAMKDKVDIKVFKEVIDPIKDDIREVRSNSNQLRAEIMDELKYIRNRVDQVADRS